MKSGDKCLNCKSDFTILMVRDVVDNVDGTSIIENLETLECLSCGFIVEN